MPITIKVNGTMLSLVHKFSSGISTATLPDVCKTPSPAGPVPIPYPNIAQSVTLSGGTTSVKGDKGMTANKGSKLSLSNGDNAGVAGGVKSSSFMKEATWILYSFDVKLQGKNAARFTDKMFHNKENSANLAGIYNGPVKLTGADLDVANKLCDEFCKDVKKNFKYNKSTKKWEKRSGVSGNTRFSDKLEDRLKAVQNQNPWKKWRVTFGNRGLQGTKTFPDALRWCANGKKWRCFDFKFPTKDYFRPGKISKTTGRRGWNQHSRQKRLAGGRKPIKISVETCSNCGE